MTGLSDILKGSILFDGIDERDIAPMLSCLGARRAGFAKGEYLLREGETTDCVGLLLSGSALIVRDDFWGNRNLIAKATPPQLFAEAYACCPGAPLGVSVVAQHPGELLWLSVARILTVCPSSCERHSALIRNLLSAIARRNLYFNEKLVHMGQRTTREKLLSYLSAEARAAASDEFRIPFDRQQLADYLSVERSAMSAELGRLRRDGVVEFEKNRFRLIAPQATG